MEESSQEIFFLRPDYTQQDTEEFIKISREYTNEAREIVEGKLYLAIIDKNHERINKLKADLELAPHKLYPYIFQSALDYRKINKLHPEVKKLLKPQISAIKQAFSSKVSDTGYSDKRQAAAFRFALEHESNKIFSEIAKKWYSYRISNELREEVENLFGEMINGCRLSKELREKIASLYNEFGILQKTNHEHPLAVSNLLKKIQSIEFSIRDFITHLHGSEQQTLNHTLNFFNKINTYHEELSNWLSRTS